MPDVDSALWVVTGAASGIGAAVVRKVAATGARILALDVDGETGAALARETGARFQHCDVGATDAWQAVTDTLANLGAPTHVHLNAGIQIAPPAASLKDYQFEAMTLERYRRMMSVNVDGVVFGLQALLPMMQPGAAIVVTASLAGITPYAVDPLYAMSKHAVVGLVRSLAPTLAKRDIRINAICPGGVDTNIIPHDQRGDPSLFMAPDHIADEVIGLMSAAETGKTWAKVASTKPAFIVRAPGDKAS